MKRIALLAAMALPGIMAAAGAAHGAPQAAWPKVRSAIAQDPALEKQVAAMVAGMTLEQKIGQMTQPEIKTATPDDVRRYYLGSILNGGGSWPNGNKRANAAE